MFSYWTKDADIYKKSRAGLADLRLMPEQEHGSICCFCERFRAVSEPLPNEKDSTVPVLCFWCC